MSTPKARILYTEDDPESRELVRFLFTLNGYELVCAESGPEALHLAKLERFDLFLVDNWMPDLSGTELTRSIREFNNATPILFYSAAAYESDKQAAFSAGAQGYLVKPVDIEELVSEVDRLLSTVQQQV